MVRVFHFNSSFSRQPKEVFGMHKKGTVYLQYMYFSPFIVNCVCNNVQELFSLLIQNHSYNNVWKFIENLVVQADVT